MLQILAPSLELRTFVQSYWVVEDLPGTYAGQEIRTVPVPFPILSVNLGSRNATDEGTLVPEASLLGLQSMARSWRSCSDTLFVMVMLTIEGLVHLFPNTGSGAANQLLDLAAVIGDAETHSLRNALTAQMSTRQIKSHLDQWVGGRLDRYPLKSEGKHIAAACELLKSGKAVAEASRALDVQPRQLQRVFARHVGIGPKEFADLERLQKSVKSSQTGLGDAMQGFCDQPHQIRVWRHRLGVTPGAYNAAVQSAMVEWSRAAAKASTVSYYL